MRTPAVASAWLLLFSRLLDISSARRTDARPDPPPVTVTRHKTTFSIARYIHGRSGVSFRDDTNAWCELIYNKAGYFATIVAGNEEYKIMYDDNGTVVDVERRDEGAGSRRLKHEEEYYIDSAPQNIGVSRRYEAVTCEACGEGWTTVCGEGLLSFCDLRKDYWHVFGPLARSSVKTMCGTFSRACRDTLENIVCVERCKIDDEDDKYGNGGDDSEDGVGDDEDEDDEDDDDAANDKNKDVDDIDVDDGIGEADHDDDDTTADDDDAVSYTHLTLPTIYSV